MNWDWLTLLRLFEFILISANCIMLFRLGQGMAWWVDQWIRYVLGIVHFVLAAGIIEILLQRGGFGWRVIGLTAAELALTVLLGIRAGRYLADREHGRLPPSQR